MMEFLKKQGVSFYLNALAILLTIIGTITFCISSATKGYAIDNFALLLIAMLAAIVLMGSSIYFNNRYGAHHPITVIVNLLAVIFLVLGFGQIILQRAILVTSLFSFDSQNYVGWGVFYQSVVSMITFLVSSVLLSIGAFTGKEKE